MMAIRPALHYNKQYCCTRSHYSPQQAECIRSKFLDRLGIHHHPNDNLTSNSTRGHHHRNTSSVSDCDSEAAATVASILRSKSTTTRRTRHPKNNNKIKSVRFPADSPVTRIHSIPARRKVVKTKTAQPPKQKWWWASPAFEAQAMFL